jgi:preprotein translocase subunit SecG
MQIWMTLILAVQLLSALAMIGLVLIQHGKGADMGASFGSGASGSLFGASGSANFLSRSTAALATLFFVTTLALAYLGTSGKRGDAGGTSVLDRAAPAASAPAGKGSAPASGISPAVPGVVQSAVPGAMAASAAVPTAASAAAAVASAVSSAVSSVVPSVAPGAVPAAVANAASSAATNAATSAATKATPSAAPAASK